MSTRKPPFLAAKSNPGNNPERNKTVRGPWPNAGDDATSIYVEGLFEQYHDMLFRYIARFTPNQEDAMEVLQDTYLRLLNQQNLDHIRDSARAYLFKVATNLLRDKARKDKSHCLDQHESFDELQLDYQQAGLDENSPLKNSEFAETLLHIKAALLEMPERCRQIFLMHRFMDMTQAEIAKALNITTRTVERNIKSALIACETRIRNEL